jgi:hypothetical protein
VIDPSGHPVAGIDVSISGYNNGPNGQTAWTRNTAANAQGYYEFSEAGPGNFALWAQDGNTRTWFPSNQQNSQHYAPWVQLGPTDAGCVYNIYLRSPDCGSYKAHRVSGTIEGTFDPGMGDRFYVELELADKVFAPIVDRLQLKDASDFTLNGVWPGKYRLTLYGEYGSGTLPCGEPSSICFGYEHHPLASRQITVTDRDVNGLRLTIGALPTLDGELVVDGALPQGWNTLHLTLFWGTETKTAKVGASGHFSFLPLDAFRYGFSLTDYPPENAYQWVGNGPVYIASATLDGKPVMGRHFELHIG